MADGDDSSFPFATRYSLYAPASFLIRWSKKPRFDLCHSRHARRRNLTVITDPLFYVLAIPAVTFLGLSKGGFAGLGMLATPLLALIVPPLEAAAILLPILFVQGALSVWSYSCAWS